MKKITALLPMKEHSERVPHKNIKKICGKPLFFYIAQTLQDSPYISSIIVNTDSNEIADLAKSNFSKVVIHQRPNELCGDFISMNSILEYDINKCNENYFLQTHSTNPLLKKESIETAIDLYLSKFNTFDSLFTVTKLQTRLYWDNGQPINHNPYELKRTQDLPTIYEENSCLYLFSKQSFTDSGYRRIGTKPQMFSIDKLEAIDIDNKSDFILAEALIKMQGGGLSLLHLVICIRSGV